MTPLFINNKIDTNGLINPLAFSHQFEPKQRYSTRTFKYSKSISFVTYPRVRPYVYTVNTEGEVYEYATRRKCIPYMTTTGYWAVALRMIDAYPRAFHIHRLVAYQFCPMPNDIPYEQLSVNHITGNRDDNTCGNLEWISYQANSQHENEILHGGDDKYVSNGRPTVTEGFIRWICEQFVAGKSNTEIMKELGMTIDNANHTLLRDIRSGYTWTNITCQYKFDRSSKKHAYTKEQKAQIDGLILKGMPDYEVFKVMQGRKYNPSTDRLDSSYRSIQTRRVALRKKGKGMMYEQGG